MTTGIGEFGSIVLRIDDKEIAVFKEYCFSNHFLTPTDGFRMVLGDEVLGPEFFDILIPGKTVQLLIDGKLQATGYLDVVDYTGDRMSGNTVVLEGRDVLSVVVDSEIDPRKRFPEKTPLDKLLKDTLLPFGFTTFSIDNEKNSSIAAGKFLKRPKKPSKSLPSYRLTQSKPHHNERYFEFVSRITQREGLWIWAGVDGKTLIVGKPDFDQAPRYQIRRKNGGATNNILSGGVRYDSVDQPSMIFATGNIPPTSYEHVVGHVLIVNPYWTSETPTLLDEVKETVEVKAKPVQLPNRFASLVARPKFVKDTESRTKDQLSRFAQRTLSLYVRRAVVGTYTFMGHELDGQVVQVDTVVDVQDDRSNWHAPMWILSRSLRKSRTGGTTTTIECLPLNSLVF